MAQAWVGECVVSGALAQSLIESQFPALAPARVELLGAGWDNTAFRVNDVLVFRFPRRQIAAPLLDAESRLLPTLAARLPLPVPMPTWVGRPTDAFTWPFAGYPMIPGRTACAAALDDSRRAATAVPLARFLAALHAVPAAEAVSLGAGPDTIARLDLAHRIPRAHDCLAQLARNGTVDDVRPFTALLDAAPPGYTPRADTLVHGDLYARQLLVDPEGRLAGVIDWGDIHLGDPAVDLAVACTFLPPAAHETFRQTYGPIADLTWRVARLRALWHTAMVLLYAHAIGDADLLREGRTALGYLSLS